MIYLSLLQLNFRCRASARDLADTYALHRRMQSLVDGLFVQRPGEPRLLYRVEGRSILLQSPVVPDWHRLPDGYLATADDDLGFGLPRPPSKRIDHSVASLRVGQVVAFRLAAWPSRDTRPQRGSPIRQRVALTNEAARRAWLLTKGDRNGFEVLDMQMADVPFPPGNKPHGPLVLPATVALYDGHLRVTDPERLFHAVACGIGDARAFGLGLLSLGRG